MVNGGGGLHMGWLDRDYFAHKGHEWQGWSRVAGELRKVMAFLEATIVSPLSKRKLCLGWVWV